MVWCMTVRKDGMRWESLKGSILGHVQVVLLSVSGSSEAWFSAEKTNSGGFV